MDIDTFKQLSSLRKLKALLKNLEIDDDLLFKVSDNFDIVAKARSKEIEEENRQALERQVKIERAIAQLESNGIPREDLLDFLKDNTLAGGPRPKYAYYQGSQYKTWTGQGRIPTPMQEQIDSGEKTITDFLIIDES